MAGWQINALDWKPDGQSSVLVTTNMVKREGIWWKREIIYPSLHCHHQTDSCVMMGSDESHFNVSLIVRDKVIRVGQCPQTTTFEEKGEPKWI